MMNLNYHNNVSFIDNNDSYNDNSKNDMILLIINTSISFLRDDNNTSNSSSNTGTNTTNYDNDNTCEICGWMAAFCSMIAFGTFGVPIKWKASKSVDVDPLVFQSYKTAMCFLTSWIVLAMGEEFSFTPWGIVSGIFWVPGGVATIYAVKAAGLAIGIGIGSSFIVLVSFIWGIFIFKEKVQNKWMACFAIVLMMSGLIGMSYFSSPNTTSTIAQAADHDILPNACTDEEEFNDDDDGNGGRSFPNNNDDPTTNSTDVPKTQRHTYIDNPKKTTKTATTAPINGSIADPSLNTNRTSYQGLDTLERDEDGRNNGDSSGTSQPIVPIADRTYSHFSFSDSSIRSYNNNNGFMDVPANDDNEDNDLSSSSDDYLGSCRRCIRMGNSNYHRCTHHRHHRHNSDSTRDEYDNNDNNNDGMYVCCNQIYLTKRQLGMCSAAFCGIYGGSILAPMKFAGTNAKGTHYLISFAIGSSIVTVSLWIIRFLYNSYVYKSFYVGYHALPSFHIRVMWLPGGTSGLLWSIGNYFSLLSVLYLGEGVGYPLVQTSILVSGLWGIFYFQEVQGFERISKWLLSSLLTICGILLLSYEHHGK